MEKLSQEIFKPIKSRFEQLVGQDRFLKEASFALQAISKNEQLKKADKLSIQEAVLNIAQTGLTLNPIHNFAYLVPRYDRNRGVVCQLMPSYQGLIKLLTDSGSIVSAYAHEVYENDFFEYSLGLNPDIKHNPCLSNRGKIIAAYAVAITKEGNKQVEVISIDTIFEIREISDSWKAFKNGKINSCVWDKWEGEMCRKTVIKRLSKYLPKTDHYEIVSRAIELDNEEYVLDPNSNQAAYILRLLMTCTLSDGEVEDLENKILRGEIQKNQIDKLIQHLHDSQPDKIDAGKNYGQKDIHDKLDRIEGKK